MVSTIFRLLLFTIAGGLLISCSGESDKTLELRVNSSTKTVLDANQDPSIAMPSMLTTDGEIFFFYDFGDQKIKKYNFDGDLITEFGSEGRGPGEYQKLSGLWILDDIVIAFARLDSKFLLFDRDGEWIEDRPVGYDELPIFPVRIELLGSDRFAMPVNGRNESLFVISDIAGEEVRYAGKSHHDYVPYLTPDDIPEAIRRQEIPPAIRNRVLLQQGDNAIYLIRLISGVLEKKSYSGDLMWETELLFDFNRDILSYMFEENRSAINQNSPIPYDYSYALDIASNSEGVAVLMRVRKDEPVKVVWVEHDESSIELFSFPELESRPNGLALSESNSTLFFIHTGEGVVTRADWLGGI